MIFVKYNSSNIPLLTHSHSLYICIHFIYLYRWYYMVVVWYSVFVLWSKKINYMKNIFLWYFFPTISSLSRPRRAPLYKHKTWLRDPPRNKRQQTKLHWADLSLLLFFSSLSLSHLLTHNYTIMSRQSAHTSALKS